jgi:hypothetical protein
MCLPAGMCVQASAVPTSGGNSMLAQLHAERQARARANPTAAASPISGSAPSASNARGNPSAAASSVPRSAPSAASSAAAAASTKKMEFSMLTWNVW